MTQQTPLRQQILNAVKATLTGLPTTGQNVFDPDTDVEKLRESDLPALVMREGDEAISLAAAGGARPVQTRRYTLDIHVVVQQKTGRTVTNNTIIAEVETALGNDRKLGGLVKTCQQQGIGAPQRYDELQKPVTVTPLRVDFTYFAAQGDPFTSL